MNTSDEVVEIAERVAMLQSQIEALKQQILSQPNGPSPERLDSKLFALESQIRNGQEYREKSDQFRKKVQMQNDPVKLVKLLHDHVLGQMTA